MAKISKRVNSDWSIGTHTVNSYKERVLDPAVVKKDGKRVYLTADNYKGNPKPKALYRVELFNMDYYVLCIHRHTVSLFSSDMIANDARRGGLVFRDETPFEELTLFYSG